MNLQEFARRGLPHLVYIGSATSPTRGLKVRRTNHEHPAEKQRQPFYIALAFDDSVDRTVRFATLFRYSTRSTDDEEILSYRDINLLAEALFSSILGAYTASNQLELVQSCVHGDQTEVLSWYRACGPPLFSRATSTENVKFYSATPTIWFHICW